MPRVTKEMMQEQINHLNGELNWRDHRIALLEERSKLLNSPASGPGQLTVQLITIQRMSEALAQVTETLHKAAERSRAMADKHEQNYGKNKALY